jgi:hypothetical protein
VYIAVNKYNALGTPVGMLPFRLTHTSDGPLAWSSQRGLVTLPPETDICSRELVLYSPPVEPSEDLNLAFHLATGVHLTPERLVKCELRLRTLHVGDDAVTTATLMEDGGGVIRVYVDMTAQLAQELPERLSGGDGSLQTSILCFQTAARHFLSFARANVWRFRELAAGCQHARGAICDTMNLTAFISSLLERKVWMRPIIKG